MNTRTHGKMLPVSARISLLLIAALLSGCGVAMPPMFHIAKAINPPVRGGVVAPGVKLYATADSLQPTLEWKGLDATFQNYDLSILEPIQKPANYYSGPWGTQVYHVENIAGTSHRVAHPLKPNTVYHWSVRGRRGNQVTPWSSFTQSATGTVVIATVSNVNRHEAFIFKTPEQ
jgi:hypothetical protein